MKRALIINSVSKTNSIAFGKFLQTKDFNTIKFLYEKKDISQEAILAALAPMVSEMKENEDTLVIYYCGTVNILAEFIAKVQWPTCGKIIVIVSAFAEIVAKCVPKNVIFVCAVRDPAASPAARLKDSAREELPDFTKNFINRFVRCGSWRNFIKMSNKESIFFKENYNLFISTSEKNLRSTATL